MEENEKDKTHVLSDRKEPRSSVRNGDRGRDKGKRWGVYHVCAGWFSILHRLERFVLKSVHVRSLLQIQLPLLHADDVRHCFTQIHLHAATNTLVTHTPVATSTKHEKQHAQVTIVMRCAKDIPYSCTWRLW